jgi:hypothetical protein
LSDPWRCLLRGLQGVNHKCGPVLTLSEIIVVSRITCWLSSACFTVSGSMRSSSVCRLLRSVRSSPMRLSISPIDVLDTRRSKLTRFSVDSSPSPLSVCRKARPAPICEFVSEPSHGTVGCKRDRLLQPPCPSMMCAKIRTAKRDCVAYQSKLCCWRRKTA